MSPVIDRELPEGEAASTDLPATTGTQRVALPWLLFVSGLTVVGLVIRLPLLNWSLSGDDLSTYWIVVGHSLGQVLQLDRAPQEVTPPLFFVAAWLTQGLLGNPGESIRLVSLIAGTSTIPMTYLLGVRSVGRAAAAVGATLITLSPILISYSALARAYMLATFLVLLSSWFLLRLSDGGGLKWAVGYAVSTCAALYTHYVVVFVLGAQLVWALWAYPRARRVLLLSNLAAALGFLPWLGHLRADLNGPNYIAYYQPFGLHAIQHVVSRWALGHASFPVSTLPGNLALYMVAAAGAVALLGLVLERRSLRPRFGRFSSRTWLVIVLALATPVGGALYSLVGADVYDTRNMLISWPGLALAVGALIARVPQPLRLLSLALLVAAFVIGASKTLSGAYQPTDVNGAASYVYRVGTSGDPVVTVPGLPAPLTEVDIAFHDMGESTHKSFALFRIGVPPREAMVHAALTQGNAHPASIHPTSPAVIAKEAAGLARRRGRTLFLITGPSPLADYGFFPTSPVAEFLSALPRDLHPFRQTTYPGLDGTAEVSVFEFHVSRDEGVH